MQSEGPYRIRNDREEDVFISGPGLFESGEFPSGNFEYDQICAGLNTAYAEGRKVVQIKTPCPSCGFTTLCVDDSGNLVCSFLECKNPTEIANKEGRKVAEKEYEAKIGLDYTISTSVKLAAFNKLENDFRDLFNIANEMSMNLDSFTDEAGNCHIKFHAWKKARGLA